MSFSRLIKVFLILILCGCLAFFLWHAGQKKQGPFHQAETQRSSIDPLNIKGLSYVTRDKGRLIAKIEADELKVKKRRFWAFNIKPINEAIFTNVRLEFHLYDDAPPKVDMLSTARSILTLNESGRTAAKGLGLITRGRINGLKISMYQAEEPFIVLKADKARIDFKRKKINMSGVELKEFLVKKLIKTPAAVWDNTLKVLKIPGPYTAEGPEGTTNGKGMDVDLGFAGNNNDK